MDRARSQKGCPPGCHTFHSCYFSLLDQSGGYSQEKILHDEKRQLITEFKKAIDPIAAQLASVRDCKMLILETPYYNFTSLVRLPFFIYPVELLSHYKVPTYQYLQKIIK